MKRGMTFIEAMVWVAIFMASMIAITNSILYFYRTNRYALEQGSAVAAAQRGIDHMVRTIREAGYAANGAYPIASIANNELIFYADTTGDGKAEKMRYYISGSSLYEGVTAPTGDPAEYTSPEVASELSEYIRNVAQSVTMFTYYDKNGLLIDDMSRIADVRFVYVTIIADVNPNDQPGTLTLHSSAAIRNLVGK